MAFSTVLLITLAAGAILVVGGGVMAYVSALVKSAYEIKVQLNNEVDAKLAKMADDLDKKARWIKRDLLEEIEKIKIALQSDSARKIADLSDPVLIRLGELERRIAGLTAATDTDRQALSSLDARLRMVMKHTARREPEKTADDAPAETATALDEAAAILAARAVVGSPAAATAPEPEPAKSDTPS